MLSGLFRVEFGLGSQRHNAVSSLHPGLSGEEKVPRDCFKFRSTAGLLLSGGRAVGHCFCFYPLEMTDSWKLGPGYLGGWAVSAFLLCSI